MRRKTSDLLLSAMAPVVLLAVIVISDPNVRGEIARRVGTPARASTEVTSVGFRAESLAKLAVQSVKETSQAHGPLMFLVVAATMLTVFMIRT